MRIAIVVQIHQKLFTNRAAERHNKRYEKCFGGSG
jgi:hypothetical protein